MQRFNKNIVFVALMLFSASSGISRFAQGQSTGSLYGNASRAVVTGTVRDSQGVALMGALIQVVTSNLVTTATALTDLHGRYQVANLSPGSYEVRASSTLFVPAVRENLQLRSGGRSVVNLTLSTLFEATSWLPAERRKADEPGDDWKWTLRSAANRPILRMVEDGHIVLVSSSATSEITKAVESGKGAVIAGDGTFGRGGIHHILALNRGLDDGSDVRFRLDMGTGLVAGHSSLGVRPSTEMQAGYQRRLGIGGVARTVVSYQSHPEMVSGGYSSGLDAIQVATAQKMQIGDFAEVELGSALDMVHTSGYQTSAHPFLRVTTHPSSAVTIAYRMATSRDMQAFNALDMVQPELPVAVKSQGRMKTERGFHQEISIGRKVGRGTIQASYYRDVLRNVLVSGGGGLGAADLAGDEQATPLGVITDTTTGAFRLLATGYNTQGINVTLTQPVTSGLWAAIEYENGSALGSEGLGTASLANVGSKLHPTSAQSATLALKGRVQHSGTNVRAAYRWQPSELVTAVDPYAAFSDQAFLSFFLRQPVNCGHWLPAGLEATVDVTNLMAQGYRPFLSADGRTLYLAQAPRSIQAGLAFTF